MSSWVVDIKQNGRFQTIFISLIAAALFIALAIWGGQPRGISTAVFLSGVILLFLFTAAFAWLGWYLLIRPLPPGHKEPAGYTLAIPYRQLIASLMAISSLSLVVGLFWDEVWHRQYGIQFGEDFFWRPHQLMYASFLITILLAFYNLFYLMRQGRGTLQQRFRTNPMLGWLVLVGGYMLFALPADPIWHEIYGVDITAWSIPHIILLFSFASISLIAAALQGSTLPSRQWRNLTALKQMFEHFDLLTLFVIALTLNTWLQVMTTDFEGLSLALLAARPVWSLPALIVAASTFCGLLANHSLRITGAATIIGLLNLGLRLLMQNTFGIPDMSASAWIIAVFPLITLDIWYFMQQQEQQPSFHWLAAGGAASVGMALVGFSLINRFYIYPLITNGNLFSMLFAVFVAASMAAWAGQRLGNYLANQATGETAVSPTPLSLLSPITLIGTIAFVIFFIVTATPPV
ncbi:MAG: hypothetical protein AAF614_12460 [Chloroflexota bacterium]